MPTWKLVINGSDHSELQSPFRPLPSAFGVEVKTAVQYEVTSAETGRILAEIDAKWDSQSDAVFSSCMAYRYFLIRRWITPASLFEPGSNRLNEVVAFVCLNPSTADFTTNDPTVRRCIAYASEWGFGGYAMLNAFAFRATEPKDMKAQTDPNGPDNDAVLRHVASRAGLVVAAWGTNASHLDRHHQLCRTLPEISDIHALKMTDGGFPGHPLYLKKSLRPQIWIPRKSA